MEYLKEMFLLSKITEFDRRVFQEIRSKPLSARVERWLKLYVRLGDGWFWGVVFIWTVISHSREELIAIVLPVFTIAVLSLLLYFSVKWSIRRERPHVAWKIEAEVPPLDRYSFPSGHTMNNLAVAMALSYFFPVIGAVAIVIPITWGILRVYYGVHYLSDVIAGVLLAFVATKIGLALSNVLGWL